MDTPLHEEEKKLPETKNTHTHPLEKKWYHGWRDIPRSIILTVVISILVIVSIIIYYEQRLDRYTHHRYDTDARYIHHIDPWYPIGWYDIHWHDYYWRNLDRQMEQMKHQHEIMLDTLSETSDTLMIGKYTGSRISDDDTLTYNIDITSDGVRGTYNGTNTGLIYNIQKGLEGLGYRVEKQGDGYTFSGATQDNRRLLELFR